MYRAMGLWPVLAVASLVASIGVLVVAGVRTVRERLVRPHWRRRHVLVTARERALAAREAEGIRGAGRREALRWRAYWLGLEVEQYGRDTGDDEMRLFGLFLKEASSTLVNGFLSTPPQRWDRLRDAVDFIAPYLLEEDRWWRTPEANRKYTNLVQLTDVRRKRRARETVRI
jgi:hypothetical protein